MGTRAPHSRVLFHLIPQQQPIPHQPEHGYACECQREDQAGYFKRGELWQSW